MKPLEIEHLTKLYGEEKAVDDISLILEPGEIFGLLGPNGAGKTTLISCITTLNAPTSGKISVFGKCNKQHSTYAKQCIGYVPQELISHGYFNVEEVLSIHSSYYGFYNNRARIEYLLKKLDLYKVRKKNVKQLSGGMKRRLLIAKALLHEPRLLLLDEPTAGVDIELRSQLWDFVRSLKEDGMTILLTTHHLEEAEKLCDRVGIIHHGKLRSIGHTQGLIDEMTHREIILSLTEDIPQIKHPHLKAQDDHTLIFLVPRSFELKTLLSDLKLEINLIRDIHIREGNLEDAFQKVLETHYG